MAEPVLDNEDIKKRATRRLFVAVALVGISAGILTWLSQYKPSQPITTQPTPDTVVGPPTIAPEPAPIAAAPAEAPSLEQMPPPEAPPATAPPALPPTLGAPPPPKVVSKPLPPPGPGPKATPSPEAAKPLLKAEQAPAPVPAGTQAPPAPSGYVVQFGVFTNTKNALQLVERLKRAGIAAQTETRVQLPPFKTKAEAEAALAKMKEKGINAVVVAR
jgi:DedD protein